MKDTTPKNAGKKRADTEARHEAAATHDPVSGLDPKQHGHLTLAALYEELRRDEAAGKREDAHIPLHQIPGGKMEEQEKRHENETELER
jgi:hypothetical protein